MSDSLIRSSKDYLEVLNLLGTKRINYCDSGLNLIYEKPSLRRTFKWYAAPLKTVFSAAQVDNVSAWADEIIENANIIRGERRARQEDQLLSDYDYKLVAPVPDWTVCLTAELFPRLNSDQFKVTLVSSFHYMNISQLNERSYFSRRCRFGTMSWSFKEAELIGTMRQIKSNAEQLLGHSPNDIFSLLKTKINSSMTVERNISSAQKKNWITFKADIIGALEVPHQ